jgi:hypothetical protein
MEFTVNPGGFWYEPMKFARVDMDISRLYYWAPASQFVALCV